MNIFIDCEFNEYGGDLISMGMIAENGKEFYRALELKRVPGEWVKEHVLPHVGPWVYPDEFAMDLQRYLLFFDACHIIADWPEDIAWFCRMLVTGPGKRIGTPPLTFEIDRRLDSNNSRVPHHALEDAVAIMECWKKLTGSRE
jgi:hypothetical protein